MSRWQPVPEIINQKTPSEPIILYEGFAELLNQKQVIEGKVIVKMSWYPSPNINFEFSYDGEDKFDTELQDNLRLKLTELIPQPLLPIRISISKSWFGSKKKTQLWGYPLEPFIQGSINDLSSITFYISNFWWFDTSNEYYSEEDIQGNLTEEIELEGWLNFNGQFIFDYDKWHIVLATLDGYTLNNHTDLEELLKSDGGYGITHICKLEKLDKTSFHLEETHLILEAFSYYLSFIRGIWIAPILLSGFNNEGNQVFKEWRNPLIKIDSWEHGLDWNDITSGANIADAFPGFMAKWQDPVWKEVIQNVIQWYIESLKHINGYNSSIVLLQAALEKLAWTYLKINECLSSNEFGGLRASGQIKLLVKFLNVNLIPIDNDDYPQIKAKARELGWVDSIQAITEIRNAIVHPPIKAHSKLLSEKIIIEAFSVSHDYLLKCLLRLFNYEYFSY